MAAVAHRDGKGKGLLPGLGGFVWCTRAAFLLGMALSATSAIAQTQDAQSRCLPHGPPPVHGYQPYFEAIDMPGQKVIANVPAYLWRHGCGPTAAGMLIGYWDGQGYPLLIPGDASSQTPAVDQAITSSAHYNDYSLPRDEPPNLLQDRSELGGAHAPHNCLGDFMKTSWSLSENYYSWSWFNDVDDSLTGYVNTFVNNTYSAAYTATAFNETWGVFTWAKFQAEIDADHPVVLLVDTAPPYGETDHFVTAIGYRDTNGYPEYACLDTWDHDVRWERFRELSNQYDWGIFGATYFRLLQPPAEPDDPDPPDGAIDVSVETDLDWADAAGATSYDVYFGTDNPPPYVGNATASEWPLATLEHTTTYYWQIVAKNAAGSTPGPVWTFVTEEALCGWIEAWGYNGSGQCNVPPPNEDFVAVAASVYLYPGIEPHSLGLRADGSIAAWGSGPGDPPAPNTGFVAVAGGTGHSLGLKADGSIVAWGGSYWGQCNVPAPNTGFVAVAAGSSHSLGLKADGSIVAWGHNGYGQCDVPAPNSDFVAIGAGEFQSLGLRADGSIAAWGSGPGNPPAPNTGFVAVAGGSGHSLGLKADGSIVAWGGNYYGQCNVPAPNSGFVGIAGGYGHSLGLKADGSLVAWGSNGSGQCNVPAPNEDFVAVAAGAGHSLGLKCEDVPPNAPAVPSPADGTADVPIGANLHWAGAAWATEYDVYFGTEDPPPLIGSAVGRYWALPFLEHSTTYHWQVVAKNSGGTTAGPVWSFSTRDLVGGSVVAWGANWDGQCSVPPPNLDFVAVAAGMDHSLGLKAEGSIEAWGDDGYGQCNVPEPNSDFAAIAVAGYFSLGLKSDGSIVAWGENGSGQCNVPAPNTGFIAIAAGGSHGLGLKADSSIVAWGDNGSGQCNVPAPNEDFVGVAGGNSHSLGLKGDGSIVAWGSNHSGQCDVPAPNIDFVAVAGGAYHSLGLRADGSIVAWGANGYGQCNVPEPNRDFVAIAANAYDAAGGSMHSLGLKSDGSIVAWGENNHGQCNVPAPNEDFVALAGGGYHSLGLKAATVFPPAVPAEPDPRDGALDVSVDVSLDWADSQGATSYEVYFGTAYPPPIVNTTSESQWALDRLAYSSYYYWQIVARNAVHVTPGPVWSFTTEDAPPGGIIARGANEFDQCNVPEPNRDFVAVTSGLYHSLALDGDGVITAWGWNEDGQCDVPAPNVGFDTVAGGFGHSLGLKDGTILAWGNNDSGQCNVPVPNADFAAIAAGGYHSLGLRLDGSIAAWGRNTYGQCDVPFPNADFVAVAAGLYHSLGIKSDKRIVAWGYDYYGQCDVPGPNTDFVSLAGGAFHSLGLKSDGTVVAWGRNQAGQCAVPAPNSEFMAIAAGREHSVGLKTDGTLVIWGSNQYGQCTAPAHNLGFAAVAAGAYHTLGLKASGPTICHGDLDCDDWVSFDDINPFILMLSNWEEWKRRYADCPEQNADVNGDGIYGGAQGFADINPFINLLASNGGHPIPCE